MNPFRRVYVVGGAGPAYGERVPPADLPIERKLEYLLKGRWLDAGEAPPELKPRTMRILAEWAWTIAGLDRRDDPALLARAHGACPRTRAVDRCYGECTDGHIIAHRVRGEPGMAALRLLHGLAHRILKILWNLPHTETDVWFLTIALAVRSRLLCDLGPEGYAAEYAHVPRWLLVLCHEWLQTYLGKKLLARASDLALHAARIEPRLNRIERRLDPPDRVYQVRLAALEVRK